jgi:DNA-binding NtrC family response regulator
MLDATGDGLELVDLGSTNGVFLGNARVQRARIDAISTTFTIGKTVLSIQLKERQDSRSRVEPIDGIVGRSEPILRLVGEIRKLARLRAPVLIIGESGVGKDVVARALHNLSRRKGEYVPLNVATIPENLADSELFGHRRGAFTGAVQARVGAFEQAHDGTLFLDEIGELAMAVQAKLLRVLEDGMVRPVGATQARFTNARVISATCAPLGERCSCGRFRFDLLQRLSMVVLEVPPLRERRSDISLLAQAWLDRFREEVGVRCLGQDAIARLVAYDWPGNVRELGSVLYRACVGTEQSIIDAVGIERALKSQVGTTSKRQLDPRELLTLAEGNVSMAARLAGLPRTTFRTWLSRAKKDGANDKNAPPDMG